jgi:hypothetical protein
MNDFQSFRLLTLLQRPVRCRGNEILQLTTSKSFAVCAVHGIAGASYCGVLQAAIAWCFLICEGWSFWGIQSGSLLDTGVSAGCDLH